MSSWMPRWRDNENESSGSRAEDKRLKHTVREDGDNDR